MIKILVTSGKGGTGKTTIAVSIAKKLKDSGLRVGILDIDVDTPNLPEMLNITERDLELSDEGIIPKVQDGIQVMSIGFMINSDIAVMWNGDRRAMAITQLMTKVDWTCDVLIIDSPPGTGEELLTIVEKFKPEGIIIVTTSHKASIADIKRTFAMLRLLKAESAVIGIIKNLSYIYCANCEHKTMLFEGELDSEIEDKVIATLPYLNETIAAQEDFDVQLEPVIHHITDMVV